MPGRRGLFVRRDSTAGTSPQDARLAIAGLVTPSGPLGVAPGVLSGCTVSGTSGWTYSVSAGHVVTTRGAADGAVVAALDGATATPAVAVAPASGSRYDLIWVRQRDVDSADTDSMLVAGVTSGTASGSPARPTADVPAGALILDEARVYAGATSTAHANVTITRVAAPVAARGGILTVQSTSDLPRITHATSQAQLYADIAPSGVLYRSAGPGVWFPVAALPRYVEATGPGAGFTIASGAPSPIGDLTMAGDVSGGFSVTSEKLIVASAGVYAISLYLTFQALQSARAYAAIEVNGVEVARAPITGDNAATPTMPAIRLPAGSQIRGVAYQSSGSPQAVNSHMRVARVAAL